MKKKWCFSPRCKAWLSGIIIIAGAFIVGLGQAYAIIDPIIYPRCGSYYEEIVFNRQVNGALTSSNPFTSIIIGDANNVTLHNFDTQGIPVSVVLTNNQSVTLLNITHPDQLDLDNNTITIAVGHSPYEKNLTLTLSRVSNDTFFSIQIIASKLYPNLCYMWISRSGILWFFGLVIIIFGFYELNKLVRTLQV